MLKAVIIDDEIDAVNSIELIINEYCNNVIVVGKAYSASEGKNIILSEKPDLVLLDIEMPRGNGFDMLEMIPNRDFDIIFITAYNNWAIKAFKYNAIDYVLKPIDIDDFVSAVKKVEKTNTNTSKSDIDKYKELLNDISNKTLNKIAISTSEGIEYIDIERIIRFEGDGSYSKVYIKDQQYILVSKNLKEFQELLEDKNFFRTHNSHFINLGFVKKYVMKDGGHIEMKDSSIVPISRRKKEAFVEVMEKYIS
jgi:two-component system LytT family response regulator